MTTHDPAFRRAFRRGKKFYGEQGAFCVMAWENGEYYPLPYTKCGGFMVQEDGSIRIKSPMPEDRVIYWNPDGKRWRRFDPAKMDKIINKAGGKHEKD